MKTKMNKMKGKLKVIVERTNTGFSAFSEKYPVYTVGQNFTELQANIVEAFNLYFEDQNKSVSANNIDFNVDLALFFQYYRVLNAKFLADRIGMNATLLSQYAQGRRKPSVKQTRRILEGIHEIGTELTDINLLVRG